MAPQVSLELRECIVAWHHELNLLRVLIYKELSFNLRDAGSHVTDRSPVVGMLFCIGLLTVGLRLCTICSLHFRTLRDHCHATIRNIQNI